MGVQRVHQRRPFLGDPNPRVAVAMNPTLMPLDHAEPPLQVRVVLHRREVIPAGEKPGAEAVHQVDHVLVNRIAVAFQTTQDRVEVGLA